MSAKIDQNPSLSSVTLKAVSLIIPFRVIILDLNRIMHEKMGCDLAI